MTIVAPTLRLNGSAKIDGVPVFDNAVLDVQPGQWTCLLGASGVGKSTILKLFAGLTDGLDFVGECGTYNGSLHGQVTLMAQDDMLLPWLTALDNVLLGARLRGDMVDRRRGNAVLQKVGLSEHTIKKPRQLSGGQRQRVALARTLMEDRPVVLLDEPFSSLDALTRALMQELTSELLQSKTVLLVTHDPGEAVRLGHFIKVMTPSGITDFVPPQAPTPRPVDDSEVLRTQAALLNRLRTDV